MLPSFEKIHLIRESTYVSYSLCHFLSFLSFMKVKSQAKLHIVVKTSEIVNSFYLICVKLQIYLLSVYCLYNLE